jgi:general secretion pathway protein F
MPEYIYRVSDSTGKIISGTMSATSEDVVKVRLTEQNYFPIFIKKQKTLDSKALTIQFKGLFQRIAGKHILAFTHQLASLLSAGLPLDRSILILRDVTENPRMVQLIEEIYKNVHGGSSFADALARHPHIFSKLYVNMVKAGEAGGVLDRILVRLSEFIEESEELKQYMISVMIYPIILTLVAAGAVIVLLTAVIPKFQVVFEDMGQALPLPTQLIMGMSDFVSSYWYIPAGLIVIAFTAIRNYINTAKGRYAWDRFRLRIPLLGNISRKLAVTRFTRTLGTLTGNGVPLLQALFIIKDVIGNEIIARAIVKVHGAVKEGENISGPLKETGVFPPMVLHMIRVGEETGTMEKMLLKVAEIYDAEVKNSVKRLISLFEPVMILLMALVVMFVVLSIVMAVFSMNALPF